MLGRVSPTENRDITNAVTLNPPGRPPGQPVRQEGGSVNPPVSSPTLSFPVTTVDRAKWVKERITFLEALLDTDVTGEQRTMIESEIAALRKEAGSVPSWLRRLIGLPRMPR